LLVMQLKRKRSAYNFYQTMFELTWTDIKMPKFL
jgi:hypothetical protein